MRKVRIAPSGAYVDWAEEFAGVQLAVINRVGMVAGPGAPIALLASQAAGQLILELPFSLNAQQLARITSGQYELSYFCAATWEIDAITAARVAGGTPLAEFMVAPAGGGGSARRITRNVIQYDDGDAPAIVCSASITGYLDPGAVAGWGVGDNMVQFGLSFPGTATGTVAANSCRLTVIELVGAPGYVSP